MAKSTPQEEHKPEEVETVMHDRFSPMTLVDQTPTPDVDSSEVVPDEEDLDG